MVVKLKSFLILYSFWVRDPCSGQNEEMQWITVFFPVFLYGRINIDHR